MPKKGLKNILLKYGTLILASITVIGLGITIYGPANILEFVHPGEVSPITPLPGVAIIRGMPEFNQDSDHLVLPIQWRNTKKTSEITRPIELILERTFKGSTKEIHFPMAGEYPNISPKAFGEVYTIKQSFVLPPDSITDTILVFHIKNFWDIDNMSIHDFRFHSGESDKIFITFQEGSGAERGPVYLDTMNLSGSIDNPHEERSYGYFWENYDFDQIRGHKWVEEHLNHFPRWP